MSNDDQGSAADDGPPLAAKLAQAVSIACHQCLLVEIERHLERRVR
jgi:hypothetical protein